MPCAMILSLNVWIMSLGKNNAFNLHYHRQRAGLSQAELAARAGISRAAVSSIETESVVPSVRAALAIARVLDCTVEELCGGTAAESPSFRWAVEPGPGCTRFWESQEIDTSLRFPVEALALNPFPPDGFLSGGSNRKTPAIPSLALACCDPAARFFASEFEKLSGVRMLVLPRNGRQALQLLSQGSVHLGGIHAATEENPDANVQRVRSVLGEGWALLRLTDWRTGIAVANGTTARTANGAIKAARRWAMREKGAAARECLDELLGARKASGRVVGGHREVADAVKWGWADAGITLELCAAENSLRFVSVRTEGLDLVFSTRLLADPRVKKLIAMIQSRAFRRPGEAPTGYSTARAGNLVLT